MSRIVDEPYFTHSAYSAFTTGIQVKCPKCHGAGVVTADDDTISLSHPFHGVSDVGDCCGVGEEYMKFLKYSSGISS